MPIFCVALFKFRPSIRLRSGCHLHYRRGELDQFFNLKSGYTLDVINHEMVLTCLTLMSIFVSSFGRGDWCSPLLEWPRNCMCVGESRQFSFCLPRLPIFVRRNWLNMVRPCNDRWWFYGIKGNVSCCHQWFRHISLDVVHHVAPGMMKYINQTFIPQELTYLWNLVWLVGWELVACALKIPDSETVSQRVCEDGPLHTEQLYYKEKVMTTNRLQVFCRDWFENWTPASGCFGFGQESMPSTKD